MLAKGGLTGAGCTQQLQGEASNSFAAREDVAHEQQGAYGQESERNYQAGREFWVFRKYLIYLINIRLVQIFPDLTNAQDRDPSAGCRIRLTASAPPWRHCSGGAAWATTADIDKEGADDGRAPHAHNPAKPRRP